MALADMKAFYRFVEEAEHHELEERKTALESLIAHINSPKAIADAKHLLKRIDSELESRQQLANAVKK